MRRQSGAGTLAALMLTCVLGATMLLSLAAGAVVYRRVADRVEQSADGRLSLSYITAKLHSGDAAGGVEVGQFGQSDAVFLYQDYGGGTYETILYVYDGSLREMLCEKGWEQDPEFGEPVAQAESLEVSQPSEGLLRLVLTEPPGGGWHSADVYVRSEG